MVGIKHIPLEDKDYTVTIQAAKKLPIGWLYTTDPTFLRSNLKTPMVGSNDFPFGINGLFSEANLLLVSGRVELSKQDGDLW